MAIMNCYPSTLKVESARSSKTLVTIHQARRRHMPEDHNHLSHRSKDSSFYMKICCNRIIILINDKIGVYFSEDIHLAFIWFLKGSARSWRYITINMMENCNGIISTPPWVFRIVQDMIRAHGSPILREVFRGFSMAPACKCRDSTNNRQGPPPSSSYHIYPLCSSHHSTLYIVEKLH